MEYGGYTTVSPGSTTAHRDGDRAWTFPDGKVKRRGQTDR